jgi:hypothetical protein
MKEYRKFGEPREIAPGQWGSITLSRMTSSAGEDLLENLRFIAPDDGNSDDRTVAEITPAAAVAPGETIRLSIDFVVQLPRVIDRSGYAGDFVLAGQWFPKIGVFGSDGWNCHQYHALSEFFADFGDYDVTIDVPRRLKGRVGGTGRLIEERDAPADRVLEHFRQEAVHDFAWTADPGFLVDTESFREPGLPDVAIVLLCQPEHRDLGMRYFAAAKKAISAFGKLYGPYPYGVLTVVDPPANARGAWGMEYPTFIACGASSRIPRSLWFTSADSLESAVVHEFAHQYFYGLLASNEFEEAWLDEGFARYSERRLMGEWEPAAHPALMIFGFPVVLRSVVLHPQLRTFSTLPKDRLTAAWKFESPETYRLVYGKTALALSTFERSVGTPTMDRLLRAYVTGFRFRHPTTADLLDVMSRVAGRKPAALFERALFSAGTVDYAVARAESRLAPPPAGWIESAGRSIEVNPAPRRKGNRYETDVLVERRGDVALPVEIRLDFEGKKTYRTVWDGEPRWLRLHVDDGPRLVRAIVDPDEKMTLDADRNNNGWIVKGNAAAANLWTARAFFWAENALDLFMELW